MADTNVVCRTCHVGVLRFGDPDGTEVWVHAKTWETFDHPAEPVIVPLAATKGVVCDFCGTAEAVTWIWSTPGDLVMIVRGARSTQSKDWATCETCDRLIRSRDLDGLTERNTSGEAHEHWANIVAEVRGVLPDSEEFRASFRESSRVTLEAVVRLLAGRRRMPPPPPPPKPIAAARMPRVRDQLAEFWANREHLISGAVSEENAILLPGVDVGREDMFSALVTDLPLGGAAHFCERMATGMRTAGLYWVSREYTLLAVTRGRKLRELTINRSQLPGNSGLLVYDSPIMEQFAAGRETKVVAASWVLVPDGIWITFYGQPEQMMPEQSVDHLHSAFGYLIPIAPGAGIRFTDKLDSEQMYARFPSMRAVATLLATLFLIRQPKITTITEQKPVHNRERRAYERAGREMPTIRIVDINRKPRERTGSQGATGTGSKWSVRVLVGGAERGFWRNQYYPSTGEHEQIWIEEFWAGPEDGPVRIGGVDVVNVLR